MAHFEKVRTGHERWIAQWPCVHVCTLRTNQSRAGLGDYLQRYWGAVSADDRGAEGCVALGQVNVSNR